MNTIATRSIFPLLWQIAIPLALLLATWQRTGPLRRGWRLGLVDAAAWRAGWWAYGSAVSYALALAATYVYETSLLLAGLALALNLLLLRLTGQMAAGIHAGLHGFWWPVPEDGLALIERERQLMRRRVLRRWWVWRLAPFAPLIALLLLALLVEDRRQLTIGVIALGYLAPLVVIPWRRLRWLPLLLLPLTVFTGWQVARLHLTLPPGRWVTPMLPVPCEAQVVVAGEVGWCPNAAQEVVYRWNLQTGEVHDAYTVREVYQVMAATPGAAWVLQDPGQGLVHLAENPAWDSAPVYFVQSAAAESDQVVWAIDIGNKLFRWDGLGGYAELVAQGPLNNRATGLAVAPDGSVWVGSIGGASRLPPGSDTWLHYSEQQAGWPGQIIRFAFGTDGEMWFMWRRPGSSGPVQDWGVTRVAADGGLTTVNLGRRTGLHVSTSANSLAVDGLGRLWVMALSFSQREVFLGVIGQDGGFAVPMVSLGRFPRPSQGTLYGLTAAPHGVFADGAGGVYLVNGAGQPLRHWRPGWWQGEVILE